MSDMRPAAPGSRAPFACYPAESSQCARVPSSEIPQAFCVTRSSRPWTPSSAGQLLAFLLAGLSVASPHQHDHEGERWILFGSGGVPPARNADCHKVQDHNPVNVGQHYEEG